MADQERIYASIIFACEVGNDSKYPGLRGIRGAGFNDMDLDPDGTLPHAVHLDLTCLFAIPRDISLKLQLTAVRNDPSNSGEDLPRVTFELPGPHRIPGPHSRFSAGGMGVLGNVRPATYIVRALVDDVDCVGQTMIVVRPHGSPPTGSPRG